MPEAEMEARVRELEEYKRETQVRLENGVHSFADLKEDIAKRFGELKSEIGALKPKPPSALQLFGALFGAIVVILTAWWSLGEKFNDRPTRSEVAKVVADAPPKPDTVLEIKSLRDEIVGLKLSVDKLNTTVEIMQKRR